MSFIKEIINEYKEGLTEKHRETFFIRRSY